MIYIKNLINKFYKKIPKIQFKIYKIKDNIIYKKLYKI